jgi:integrase
MLPRSIKIGNFDKYIKEACRLAGLTEKGRLLSKPEKELCDCISSHTARRSYITNKYLEGVRPFLLMKITGHKTEKSFFTYLKLSKDEAAKQLEEHQMNYEWDLTESMVG